MRTCKDTEKRDPQPREEIINTGRLINSCDVRIKDQGHRRTCEELYVTTFEKKLDIINNS